MKLINLLSRKTVGWNRELVMHSKIHELLDDFLRRSEWVDISDVQPGGLSSFVVHKF